MKADVKDLCKLIDDLDIHKDMGELSLMHWGGWFGLPQTKMFFDLLLKHKLDLQKQVMNILVYDKFAPEKTTYLKGGADAIHDIIENMNILLGKTEEADV